MHVKLKYKEEEIIIHVETGQANVLFTSNAEHRSHLRWIKLARVWVDIKDSNIFHRYKKKKKSKIWQKKWEGIETARLRPPSMSRKKYLNTGSISFTASGNPVVRAEQRVCPLKQSSQWEVRGQRRNRENFTAFLFNSTQKSRRNFPLLCNHTYTHTHTQQQRSG